MRFFSNSSPASCVDSSRCSRTIVSDDDDDDDDDAKKDDEDDDDDDDDIDGDDDTRWTRRRRFLFPRRLFWPPRKTPSPPPKKKGAFFAKKRASSSSRHHCLSSFRFVSFRFVSSERERKRKSCFFVCVCTLLSKGKCCCFGDELLLETTLFEHIMERESVVLISFRLQYFIHFSFFISLSLSLVVCNTNTQLFFVLLGRWNLFFFYNFLYGTLFFCPFSFFLSLVFSKVLSSSCWVQHPQETNIWIYTTSSSF